MILDAFFKRVSTRSEAVLAAALPPEHQCPEQLHQAMRYSVLGGGKRLRPSLVYATGECFGVPTDHLDCAAAAVELLHAYSLIHDDLPAMDDDDLRRGKPSCHKAFGEAVAILAGDTLQCLAFAQLLKVPVSSDLRISLIQLLADAGGSTGLAGGQAIDLYATNRAITVELLEEMHNRKTGALIRASILLGAKLSENLDEETEAALYRYGTKLGLSFQIMDDILDVEASTSTLGKPQGSDQQMQKATYPAVTSLEQAHKRAGELLDSALAELTTIPTQTDLLEELARFVVNRKY